MEDEIKQANPMLHRYLFKVTTFSKLLAMILFITLPFLGFYLGMQYQQELTVNPPVILEVQKTVTPIPTTIPNPTSCNTDNDCQNGAKCLGVGPILVNQPVHKECVQKGQITPL